MNQEEFEAIFEHVVGQSREVLVEKAREYASDGDRMHNFKRAAAMTGRTPEQALWGMNVKHIVSVTDMVESGASYSPEKWDEKIGDALNYLILLRALLYEANSSSIRTQLAAKDPLPPMQAFIAQPSQTSLEGA